MPANGASGKLPAYYDKEEHIKNINAGLKKLAAAEGADFIDLYSTFVDEDGNLPQKLTFDGVHLTKDGHDKWAKLLRDGGSCPSGPIESHLTAGCSLTASEQSRLCSAARLW